MHKLHSSILSTDEDVRTHRIVNVVMIFFAITMGFRVCKLADDNFSSLSLGIMGLF
jgi:hypothetical protein